MGGGEKRNCRNLYYSGIRTSWRIHLLWPTSAQCCRNAAIAFNSTSERTMSTWKTAMLLAFYSWYNISSQRWCAVVSRNNKDVVDVVGSFSRRVYFTFSWLLPRFLSYVWSTLIRCLFPLFARFRTEFSRLPLGINLSAISLSLFFWLHW